MGGGTAVRRLLVASIALTLLAAGLGPIAAVPSAAAVGGPVAEALPVLPGGDLHPVVPYRLVDTRDGTGGFSRPVGAAKKIDVTVLGRGPVPASGVTGVVLNVTATGPTANAFVTVWPTGVARPTASNLNLVPGATVPNLVQVKVGTGGKVSAFNSAGSTQLIIDVTAWIGPAGEAGTAGLFHPLVPARILDTRTGTGAPAAKVGPARTVALQVTGRGGVPATGVGAVALNVTVTEPTAATFVTAYPSGSGRPLASNLNAVPGQTVPNRVVTAVGSDGKVVLYNNAGSLHLVADVSGWYTDGSDPTAIGGRFVGITPVRVLDTRTGGGPLGDHRIVSPLIAGGNGIPGVGTQVPGTAVVANVTATEPTAAGYLTAFPSQAARPVASDVNFVVGGTTSNLIITKLGADGKLSVFDQVGGLGHTQLIVDVMGYYAGDTVLSKTAKVLGAPDVAALTAPAGPDSTTLTFSPIPARLASVAVGDTLVSDVSATTPTGLLKKVLAVHVSGATLTLTVENGSLADVILLGDIDASGAMDATTVDPASVAAVGASSGDVTAAPFATVDNSVGFTVNAKFPDAGSVAATVTGKIELKASFTLDAHRRPGSVGLAATAIVALQKSVDIKLGVKSTVDLGSITVLIGRLHFAAVRVPVGVGVWIVVVPELLAKVTASGSVSASASVGVHDNDSLTTGVQIDDNGDFHPIYVPGHDAGFDPPTGETEMEGKVAVEPGGGFELYGVTGPEFSPALFAKLTIDQCETKVEIGVQAEGEWHTELFGWSKDWTVTFDAHSSPVFDNQIGFCAENYGDAHDLLVSWPVCNCGVSPHGSLYYIIEVFVDGALQPDVFVTDESSPSDGRVAVLLGPYEVGHDVYFRVSETPFPPVGDPDTTLTWHKTNTVTVT